MKVASWNVNSIRVRLDAVRDWIDAKRPDVLCLQETKVTDDLFPKEAFEEMGYQSFATGQKSYNGVATLVRGEGRECLRDLPGDTGDSARRFLLTRQFGVTVANLYVPNGSSVGSDKYDYKLRWLERLPAWLQSQVDPTEPLCLCGDFNIAPEDRDIYDPEAFTGEIMASEEERDALRKILAFGLDDTLRLREQGEGVYSWWNYRQAAFQRNRGWRIDLILTTAPMTRRLLTAGVDTFPRKLPRPSDHAPIYADFADPPR